jgi:hypothetical protein
MVTFWRRWIGKLSTRASHPQQKDSREDIIKRTLEAAAIAEAEGNADTMRKLSYRLIGLERYERAWELYARAVGLKQQSPIPEWEGGDLADRSILIRAYPPWHTVGEELRLARFIAPVAQRARRCIVLGENRLVPLLQRSFPKVDVRPRGIDDEAAFAEADVAAYYQTIAHQYAKTADDISRFVHLRADPILVNSLRQRYKLRSRGPLIGFSWSTSNERRRRRLPDLQSWAPLLAWTVPTFVSLQYGDIKRDLEALQGIAGGRVIHDTEINPLVDLESFAAQTAALDAVVSISNTTIDMAGMLGVPTIHLRDGKPSRYWPPCGPSPWYPDMMFLYKKGRPWRDVFTEVKTSLEKIISMVASL